MKTFLYGWIRDIAYYTLLMVVVLHVLPDQNQKKYLQFFMGVVLIILVMTPFLTATGLDKRLNETYTRQTYDRELQAFMQDQEQLEAEYETYVREQLEAESLETGEQAEEEPQKGEMRGIPEIHIEIRDTWKD